MNKLGRNKTVIGILLGLTVLLAGGSALYANFGPRFGHGFHNPEMHADWIRYYLTKQLNLDDAQQQKLEGITQDLLTKGKALHQQRQATRQEALDLLRADSVDKQRIEQLVAQSRDAVDGFITTAGSRLADFVDMLTPEQRQRLAEMIETHEAGAGCR